MHSSKLGAHLGRLAACVRAPVCVCESVRVCAAGVVYNGGLPSAHDLALGKAKVCRVLDRGHSVNPFCFFFIFKP